MGLKQSKCACNSSGGGARLSMEPFLVRDPPTSPARRRSCSRLLDDALRSEGDYNKYFFSFILHLAHSNPARQRDSQNSYEDFHLLHY